MCEKSQTAKTDYNREWRNKHVERVREYKRRWYLENRDTCKANSQRRRREHPEYVKNYSAKNRKYLREYSIKWYRDHPERSRERTWDLNGIDMTHWSYEQYREMFERQRGKCLGCGCDMVMSKTGTIGKYSVAHVDHNHCTGRVRGLLCGRCNDACGKTGDSPEILRRLASYLESV